jgi:CheY-like chemotaxis protein
MEMRRDVSTGTPTVLPVSPPLTGSNSRFRIFHVNDSTDDQVLFQAACRRAGVPFDWHVTDSAQKGISYLRTLVEQSAKIPVCWPDLVVLDIVMPFVSGFEVLKYVRATPEIKHLPVIIFSGHLLPDNEQESLRLGANAFRMKPSEFEDIVRMARELHQLLKSLRDSSSE